ncbi:hypothetical protein FRB96_009084 [Tulasnella sp. 330]|nr:hypothetical protein FRB96_009084 [Tulasnella sp. 330]
MLHPFISLLLVMQMLYHGMVGGPTFELTQLSEKFQYRIISTIVDPDNLYTPAMPDPRLFTREAARTASFTGNVDRLLTTTGGANGYVPVGLPPTFDVTGEWIPFGDELGVESTSVLASGNAITDATPAQGTTLKTFATVGDIVHVKILTDATNSSAVAFTGPVATLDQLNQAPRVSITYLCRQWAAVSNSRLASGISIPLKAISNTTLSGFRIKCYDWRRIVILPSPFIIDSVPVPFSHRDLTGIKRPQRHAFNRTILVAEGAPSEPAESLVLGAHSTETATELAVDIHSPRVVSSEEESDVEVVETSGSGRSSISSHIVHPAAPNSTLQLLAGSPTRTAHEPVATPSSQIVPRRTIAVPSFDWDLTISCFPDWHRILHAIGDSARPDSFDRPLILHAILSLIIITGLHKDIRPSSDVNRSREGAQKEIDSTPAPQPVTTVSAVDQAEMESLKSEVRKLRSDLVVAKKEHRALDTLKRTALATADNEYGKLRGTLQDQHLEMQSAISTLTRRLATEERESKEQLAETQEAADRIVQQLQTELSGKDLAIAGLKSQLDGAQTVLRTVTAISDGLAHKKDVAMRELARVSVIISLLAREANVQVAARQEAERSLREQVADAKKGQATADVDAAVAIDTINGLQDENATLRANLANLAQELEGAVQENAGLRFDVRLDVLRKARITSLEDRIKGFGGEVGCVETDILKDMAEPSGDEDMAHYSDPLDNDDSEIVTAELIPEVAVTGELPEVSPTRAFGSYPEVIEAPVTQAADVGAVVSSAPEAAEPSAKDADAMEVTEPAEHVEAPRERRKVNKGGLFGIAFKGIGAAARS